MFNSGQTLLRSIFSRNQRMFRRMRRDDNPLSRFPRYQRYLVQAYQFNIFQRARGWQLISNTEFNNQRDAFQNFNVLCTFPNRTATNRIIVKVFGVSPFGAARLLNECDSNNRPVRVSGTSTACCKECETGATKCGCKTPDTGIQRAYRESYGI